MIGGYAQHDSFGVNWGFQETSNAFDNLDGGFFEEDISHPPDEDSAHKEKGDIAPKQTFMPLKISMIYNAWKLDSSAIKIFNVHVELVKIIGQITMCKMTENRLNFVIDDGTGCLLFIYIHPKNLSDYRLRRLQRLEEKKPFVKCYGNYNPVQSSKYPTIIAHSIKELSSFDEYTLHELDVMHNIITHENATPQSNQNIPNMNDIFNQFGTVRKTEPEIMADSKGVVNPAALTKYISLMLAKEDKNVNSNGLHITEIIRRCKQMHSFQAITEAQVRQSLAELEKDATVYQTVDSNTFASIND
ncbi:bifunctional Winged helix-like DNA-binding domain superfamily/Nucleic acid-binding [Babesia duncani]|uniref:Bifunctional Winged helix-like DNA-binding domain superfamily/Nucleic acid-binding n=1 Tax=Babesia duncani TaxID=323732 RepID=A0AAD9UMT9_9APIC|nr:bifunctional Winged helix-like DNA-binding domain superfamily/Nucleic acid-binding [Babesia duncani]